MKQNFQCDNQQNEVKYLNPENHAISSLHPIANHPGPHFQRELHLKLRFHLNHHS